MLPSVKNTVGLAHIEVAYFFRGEGQRTKFKAIESKVRKELNHRESFLV